MRGASRTGLVLLVLARPTPAGESAAWELSADVTAVETRAGLLRDLGWPLVVGDRLEGRLRIGADGRGRLVLACGRAELRHGPFRVEGRDDPETLRFEAGPRTLPTPDGPVAVVTILDGGLLELRLARTGPDAGDDAPPDRVEARVVVLRPAPPDPPSAWWVPLLVAGLAVLALAAGLGARLRRRPADGPRPFGAGGRRA